MSFIIHILFGSILFTLIFLIQFGRAMQCYQCNTTNLEDPTADCVTEDTEVVDCILGCVTAQYLWRYKDIATNVTYKYCLGRNISCQQRITEPSLNNSVLVIQACQFCDDDLCNSAASPPSYVPCLAVPVVYLASRVFSS